MTDPRKYQQQPDGVEVNTEPHGDPIENLEIRPESIDQVKGGAKKQEDPDAGGEGRRR